MAKPKNDDLIAQRLGNKISDEVGNSEEDELQTVMSDFDKVLADVIGHFNMTHFDRDGFITKLQSIELENKSDQEAIRKILGGIRSDFNRASFSNNTDMLLRRDIANICAQMPEMRECVYMVRDAIIESDTVTGGVSRTIIFGDGDNDRNRTVVSDIESKYDLLMAIKNFCIPQTLMIGEMYINVIPYSRLFEELEEQSRQQNQYVGGKYKDSPHTESYGIFSQENLRYLKESVSMDTKVDTELASKVEQDPKLNQKAKSTSDIEPYLTSVLKNIDVYNGGPTILLSEMGVDGLREFLKNESGNYIEDREDPAYFENVIMGSDDGNGKNYSHIKGCYIKYLDPLKVIPVRLDRRVIGYYYVTTTADLQSGQNPVQPNGLVDISFNYMAKDQNLVNSLANIIIRSFDKRLLEKNIQLKNEIADIIMEHRFNEARLQFIYIPENEVVRLVINEDSEGKGHSIIEPSLFPARMYLLLTAYNMIYTLNNTTTRVHYIKSSGLNKDYAAQIQRAMRKYQARRITIDDFYSYSGALNKISGVGEMFLPSGRGDNKALETDTIQSVDNPINMEFLELQRRQAISGTGVPALMIMNAIDEIDFAASIKLANSRFLSTVSSYKIDFNRGFTKLYRLILRYSSDLSDAEINSLQFKFNETKQSMLSISSDMIQNFNTLSELISQIYFNADELATEEGKPTDLSVALRKEIAREFLPQLNYAQLDDIVNRVRISANERELERRVAKAKIEPADIQELKGETNDDDGENPDEEA